MGERLQIQIGYKDSLYFFRIYESTGYYNSVIINYSPGEKQILDATSDTDWSEVPIYFQSWLSNLHREINSTNLWDRLNKQVINVPGHTSIENSKFTYEEYKDVTAKLRLLIGSLSNLNLQGNQELELKRNIERLIELAETSPKVDWMNQFVGAIISVVITLNVSPEKATTLWELIKKVFNNYFLS